MLPLARIQAVIGRGFRVASDAEQRAEGIERVEPAVKAERELVEVGLQMLRAHAVMCALQPRFEVRKNEVDHRQVVLSPLGLSAFDHRKVLIAARAERGVARQAIRYHHRSRLDSGLYKAAQSLFATVRHGLQAEPTGIAPTLAELGVAFLGLSLADLNGGDHKRLVVHTLAAAVGCAADPCFVNLDMILGRAADPVTIRSDHSGAQFVQKLERGFVAGNVKLPLELHGRHSRRHAGNEIGAPEPSRDRHLGPFHNRAGGQCHIAPTSLAAQHTGPGREAVGRAGGRTMRAFKPIFPSDLFEIGSARCVIGEKPLEFGQGFGKRQIAAPVNVLSPGGAVHARITSTSICGCQPDRHGSLDQAL
jgi:hypothetical protein